MFHCLSPICFSKVLSFSSLREASTSKDVDEYQVFIISNIWISVYADSVDATHPSRVSYILRFYASSIDAVARDQYALAGRLAFSFYSFSRIVCTMPNGWHIHRYKHICSMQVASYTLPAHFVSFSFFWQQYLLTVSCYQYDSSRWDIVGVSDLDTTILVITQNPSCI